MLDNTKPVKFRNTDGTDCAQVCERVAEVERKMTEITSAFVRNDLSKPDYDGHRKAHLGLIESAKIIEGYKITATTKIIGALIGIFVLLVSAGFTSKLQEFLK